MLYLQHIIGLQVSQHKHTVSRTVRIRLIDVLYQNHVNKFNIRIKKDEREIPSFSNFSLVYHMSVCMNKMPGANLFSTTLVCY